jgi:hypothetical protein
MKPWSDDIKKPQEKEFPEEEHKEHFTYLHEARNDSEGSSSWEENIIRILQTLFESAKNGVQFDEAKKQALTQLGPYLKLNCNWKDKEDCVRQILKLVFIPMGKLPTLMWIGKRIMELPDKELERDFRFNRYFIGRRAKDVEKYLRAKKPGKNLL